MVFGFDQEESSSQRGSFNLNSPSDPVEVSKPFDARDWLLEKSNRLPLNEAGSFLALSQTFPTSSTIYSPNLFEIGSTGTILKKAKQRNRPPKHARKLKPKDPACVISVQQLKEGSTSGSKEKRKAVDKGKSTAKSIKLNPQMVVPNEGPSNA